MKTVNTDTIEVQVSTENPHGVKTEVENQGLKKASIKQVNLKRNIKIIIIHMKEILIITRNRIKFIVVIIIVREIGVEIIEPVGGDYLISNNKYFLFFVP